LYRVCERERRIERATAYKSSVVAPRSIRRRIADDA
jgi:hypothetical protein